MSRFDESVFALRFVFVAGKGGVGKTTVAAALALAAAKKNLRVLIALCNVEERLSQMLEVPPIGNTNERILPNIDAVNMTPAASLREYGTMVLKSKTLYKAVFENRLSEAFLRATPGMDAWSMLGKAWFHTTETLADGQPRYDMVILDAPATGHILSMLRVPQVIVDVAPAGLLRREAARALELFRDPNRCGVLLVTLAEEMPVNETLELSQALDQELRIPMKGVLINRMVPPVFTDEQAQLLTGLPKTIAAGDEAVDGLLDASRRRALLEMRQRDQARRLESQVRARISLLPALPSPPRRTTLEELAS